MCRSFKKIELDSELVFDHKWHRSFRIGAVKVFEIVRLVSYEEYIPDRATRFVYFRGVSLDENHQRRLGKLRNFSTTPLMYLMTLVWVSLYVILDKMLTKERVILNAEHEKKWQKKWPFVADIFPSVRRDKKLKELGI